MGVEEGSSGALGEGSGDSVEGVSVTLPFVVLAEVVSSGVGGAVGEASDKLVEDVADVLRLVVAEVDSSDVKVGSAERVEPSEGLAVEIGSEEDVDKSGMLLLLGEESSGTSLTAVDVVGTTADRVNAVVELDSGSFVTRVDTASVAKIVCPSRLVDFTKSATHSLAVRHHGK